MLRSGGIKPDSGARFAVAGLFRASGCGRDLACLAVLVALVLAFFWRYVSPDPSARLLFPDGDFIDQFYPWRHYASFELANGRLPLWTPFANSGHPFLADIQTAVLYPPHLILAMFLRLRGDPFLSLLDMEWLAVTHFILAGCFTYLFIKRQTGSRLAGLAGAMIFTFSSYVTTYPPLQLGILETIVWIPLALLMTAEAVSRRSRLLWALLGAVLAVSLLAGHPQHAAYSFYLVLAFGAFTIVTLVRTERLASSGRYTDYLPHVAGLAFAFVISLAIASVELLPAWELISFSSRSDELSFQFTRNGFDLTEALGLVFPNVWGGKPLFIGIIPVLLIVFNVWKPRIRGTIFWTCVAAVAFILSFGGNLPAYDVFYCCVPGFSWFRGQERTASITTLAGSILAGYGMASALVWTVPEWRSRLRIILKIAAIFTGAGGLAAGISYFSGLTGPGIPNPALIPDAVTMSLFAAAAVLILWVAKTRYAGRKLAMAGLVGLAVTQLFIVNWGNFEPGGKDSFERTPLMDFLQSLPDDKRIELTKLPTNLGYVYRLRTARGAGPLVNRYYSNVMERPTTWKGWQLLNTGYIVDEARDEGWIYSYENTGVYETDYDILPAYVSFRPRVETDDDRLIHALEDAGSGRSSEEFVFGRDAVLPKELSVPATGKGHVRSLQVTPDDAGHMSVRLDITAPGVLVLSEVYFPGWKALLDGKETEVHRVNYLLRGIEVPAGPHVIHLAYRPDSVKLGFALSAAGLVLVLGIAFGSLPCKRKWKNAGYAAALLAAYLAVAISWQGLSSIPRDSMPLDWDDLSRYLEARHLPGDALVVQTGELPGAVRLPNGMGMSAAGIIPTHPAGGRVWWLSAPDAPASNGVRPQPADGLQVVEQRWFGGQLLSLLVAPEAIIASAPTRLDYVLGNRIALRGYSTSLDGAGNRAAGGSLEVHLYLQALQDVEDDFAVFIHLVDRDGKTVAQSDSQPAGGGRPTSGWEPKEVVADWAVLPLPSGLARGELNLVAGLYRVRDGQRLTDATGRDHILLGQIALP